MAQNSYLGHIQITALSFAPGTIAVGESTQMTITLKNTSGRALSGLSATLNAFYRTAAPDALGRNYGAFFRSEALNIDPRYGGFGGVSWANNATMTITQTLTFVPDDETYGAIDDSGRLVLTAESDGRTVGYLVNPSTGQYDDALIGSAVGLNIQWHSSYGNDVFLDISGGYGGDLVLLSHRWLPAASLSLQRGLADGTPSDEGERLLLTAQLGKSQYADVSGMACRLYYAAGAAPTTASSYVNLTASIAALLAGVTDDVSLVTQTFSNGNDWYFLLWFGDAYESASASASVSRAFANLHLSGASTGGAAFGRFSSSTEGNPRLESEYPFFAYGGIYGVTNYSADEVDTGGTWIDGKRIYRRVVSVGTIAAGGNQGYSLGLALSDISSIIRIIGGCKRSNGTFAPLPNPTVGSTSVISVYVAGATSGGTTGTAHVYVGPGSASGIAGGAVAVEYTKV